MSLKNGREDEGTRSDNRHGSGEKMALKNDRSTPLLSLVIPLYNETSCIDGVCSELHQVLSENSDTIPTWECILVDDGSRDQTGRMIADWAARHARFRAVHLTLNSGQSAALQAGFQAARGLYIETMDGDGQNDPLDLILLLGELQRRRVDMMCGIWERHADSVIRLNIGLCWKNLERSRS